MTTIKITTTQLQWKALKAATNQDLTRKMLVNKTAVDKMITKLVKG
jgi:hypothetical protein